MRRVLSKKEIWVFLRAPLFLGMWCGVATYFFMQKKKKKKTKCKIYIQKCFECYWLNKEQYNFGKLNLTTLWVLVTIYVKEYNAFGPSYNLPKFWKNKNKNKNKTLIYLSKNLSPEARLRNGKVLGTHSARTESGLLDSNDQYTLFCMMWMICWQTFDQN